MAPKHDLPRVLGLNRIPLRYVGPKDGGDPLPASWFPPQATGHHPR